MAIHTASKIYTLISSIQESIQSLELNTDSKVIGLPCITHNFQPNLTHLLEQMRVNPKNETAEMESSADFTPSLRGKSQEGEIVHALNKSQVYCVALFDSPPEHRRFGPSNLKFESQSQEREGHVRAVTYIYSEPLTLLGAFRAEEARR